MISYPIKPCCRVLEAAYKHNFCSVLLTVMILQPHLLIMSPLVKSCLSVTRPGCDRWAAGWGHTGGPDSVCPQPSWHRRELCTSPSSPTLQHERRYFPGLALGLQNSMYSAREKAVGDVGCSINLKSSCKDPSAHVGRDTSAPRHRGELA